MSRWVLLCLIVLTSAAVRADEYDVINADGDQETIIGRLHGASDVIMAIEQEDGGLVLVPTAAVLQRRQGDDITPITCQEMKSRLEERFTPELTRWRIEEPFVCGIVLMAPLDQRGELASTLFLKKACDFMKNVETVFLKFTKEMRIEAQSPEFPLVLLIFESDDDFEAYATNVTGGRGLSATNIAGFYNQLDNYLAIRMTECGSFEVPLHEAIHQQVFNRGVLKRMAPIPTWFGEGMATGFEGDGEKISQGPTKLHSRYALAAAQTQKVGWKHLIDHDDEFHGDVLAGEAYCLAWGLHWLLVTQHKVEYMKYLNVLSKLEPFQDYLPEERRADLDRIFNQPLEKLEQEFMAILRKNQARIAAEGAKYFPAGILMVEDSLANVKFQVVNRVDLNGMIQAKGELQNVSPLREMSFQVRVVMDSGTYAEWVMRGLASRKKVALPQKVASQVLPGMPGGPGRTFRIDVTATPSGSELDQQWAGRVN